MLRVPLSRCALGGSGKPGKLLLCSLRVLYYRVRTRHEDGVVLSLETLKALRVIVPGLILGLVYEPLLKDSGLFEKVPELADTVLLGYSITAVVLGFLYYVCDLRSRLVFRGQTQHVRTNIADGLMKCSRGLPDLEAAGTILAQERRLMNVFYKVVDNDSNLSEKAKLVRFHGLVWSSVADVFVIGLLGGATYLAASLAAKDRGYAIASAVLLLVSLCARLLVPVLTNQHIKLSNQQLDVINEFHRDEVVDYMRKALDVHE